MLNRRFAFTIIALLLAVSALTSTAAAGEFRAFWVDTWHAGILDSGQTSATVSFAKSCNANAIIAQVSKVADSYFTSSYLPRATNVAVGYDALADVITKAHAQGMEVHAWVCVYRCWTQMNPAPWPEHVYNAHPSWLSQTSTGAMFAGTESYLDPGNPSAMAWLIDVYMEIVNNYDIDGLNFDRIRYPSTDWGYNPTAVGRFNTEYGRTGTPNAGDPVWIEWRKAQINAFVKQMYCRIMAVKPHVKLGASVWKTASSGESGYLQDWDSWTSGHYIDYVCPMNYTTSNTTWSSNNAANAASAYGRHVYPGHDVCSNSASNTAWQVDDAIDDGNPGVALYSYACTTSSHRDALVAGPWSSVVSTAAMSWKSSPTKGIVSGFVYKEPAGRLYNAQVTISGAGTTTTTDGTGFYGLIDVSPGTYTITISKCGYVTQTITGVVVTAGAVTTQDVTMVPDGVPPTISSVQATDIQATNAVITWTTNEVSSTQVEYGTTISYGNITTENTYPVTSHSMQIINLTPNTIYHYRVISKDCAGAGSTSGDYTFTTAGYDTPADIIKDDADPSGVALSGSWISSSHATQWGSGYKYCSGAVQGKSCTWTPQVLTSGGYNVYAWWVSGSNRATNAPYFIQWSGGSTTINVNQTANGGQWNLLTSNRQFAAGTTGYVRLSNSGVGSTVNVIADAIKLASTGDYMPPSTPTNLHSTGVTTNRVDMAWNASTDNVGVTGYKVYRGAAMFTTVTTTSTYSGGLLANCQYTYRVAATDAAGNVSAQSDPLACYTLPLAPTAENVTCDRATNTWYDTALFTFTSTEGFGLGVRQYFRVVWDTNPTYTFTGGEDQWSADTYGARCEDPGIYYLHLQSCNGDGAANGTLDIGPFKYDGTAPAVAVTDDGMYTDAAGQLHAVWTGSDPDSGVVEYQYAVGTTSGGADVCGWTSVGAATSVTTTGLILTPGVTYFVSVKALNGAGEWSDPVSSDGIKAAGVVSTISAAKGLPNDTAVILNSKVMSAAFGAYAYVQEGDRSSGIRMNAAAPAGPATLSVAGTLAIINGERVLALAEVKTTAAGTWPSPLLLVNHELGGDALNAYTPGVSGAVGANNLGLLITTTGRVTYSGSGYCYINDGSNIVDGSGNLGVKVDTSALGSTPALDAYVVLTGISSVDLSGGNAIRVIRAKSSY